jgi:hypothetical protein
MTMNSSELQQCWRCAGLNFWRSPSRDGGTIHCSHCEPARAHWLIAERLRAAPLRLSALERAICYLRAEIKNRQAVSAKSCHRRR